MSNLPIGGNKILEDLCYSPQKASLGNMGRYILGTKSPQTATDGTPATDSIQRHHDKPAQWSQQAARGARAGYLTACALLLTPDLLTGPCTSSARPVPDEPGGTESTRAVPNEPISPAAERSGKKHQMVKEVAADRGVFGAAFQGVFAIACPAAAVLGAWIGSAVAAVTWGVVHTVQTVLLAVANWARGPSRPRSTLVVPKTFAQSQQSGKRLGSSVLVHTTRAVVAVTAALTIGTIQLSSVVIKGVFIGVGAGLGAAVGGAQDLVAYDYQAAWQNMLAKRASGSGAQDPWSLGHGEVSADRGGSNVIERLIVCGGCDDEDSSDDVGPAKPVLRKNR